MKSKEMLRKTLQCALTGAALFFAGCLAKENPPEPPNVAARHTLPEEHLVEKTYKAKLGRMNGTDRYYLQIDGMGCYARTIADPNAGFRDKITGVWSTGWGTEDYPASFTQYLFLELLPDNSATYRVENGREVLTAVAAAADALLYKVKNGCDMLTGKNPPVIFVKSKVFGPYRGKWKITGDNTIEIRLYLPKDDHFWTKP